jgi:hypothetical protein
MVLLMTLRRAELSEVVVPAVDSDNPEVFRLIVTVLRDVLFGGAHVPSPFSQR